MAFMCAKAPACCTFQGFEQTFALANLLYIRKGVISFACAWKFFIYCIRILSVSQVPPGSRGCACHTMYGAEIHLKQQREQYSGKQSLRVVIHGQMNISAISHSGAVNSPGRGRGKEAAAELWTQLAGSSAAVSPHTIVHIWIYTYAYVVIL